MRSGWAPGLAVLGEVCRRGCPLVFGCRVHVDVRVTPPLAVSDETLNALKRSVPLGTSGRDLDKTLKCTHLKNALSLSSTDSYDIGTGVLRAYESASSQDPTVGLSLKPYGGPRGRAFSYERCSPVPMWTPWGKHVWAKLLCREVSPSCHQETSLRVQGYLAHERERLPLGPYSRPMSRAHSDE